MALTGPMTPPCRVPPARVVHDGQPLDSVPLHDLGRPDAPAHPVARNSERSSWAWRFGHRQASGHVGAAEADRRGRPLYAAHLGRVHRVGLDAGALGHPRTTGLHGLGLGEAVELARVLGRLPGRLAVYAVEGADSALGTGMSPVVEAVVGPLAEDVEDETVRHRDAAARG